MLKLVQPLKPFESFILLGSRCVTAKVTAMNREIVRNEGEKN